MSTFLSPAIPTTLVQSPNTVIHGNASVLVPQPDMEITFNQYGIMICYTNYVVDKTLALAQMPGRWSPHPFYPGLLNSIGEMKLKHYIKAASPGASTWDGSMYWLSWPTARL